MAVVIPAHLQGYFDIDGDLKAVSFLRQASPSTYDTAVSLNVQWRPRGRTEADISKGGYQVENVTARIRKTQLATAPTAGDVIQYNGLSYVIGSDGTREVGALGAWEVNLMRPYFKDAIDTTISVYRAQPSKDSSYRITKGTETLVYSNIPAYIQASDTFGVVAVGVSEGIFGKLAQPLLFTIYISSTIQGAQPHDRIVDAGGTSYSFHADSKVNQLGIFQSFQCYRHL